MKKQNTDILAMLKDAYNLLFNIRFNHDTHDSDPWNECPFCMGELFCDESRELIDNIGRVFNITPVKEQIEEWDKKYPPGTKVVILGHGGKKTKAATTSKAILIAEIGMVGVKLDDGKKYCLEKIKPI